MMLKNITLSADEALIAAARARAAQEGTTLNGRFRGWLESYIKPPIVGNPFHYSGEEVNERRPDYIITPVKGRKIPARDDIYDRR